MKKSIAIVLLIIITINTLIPIKSYAENTVNMTVPSSADEAFNYQTYEDVEKEGVQNYNGIIESGKITVNGREEQAQESGYNITEILKILIRALCLIPQSAQLILSVSIDPYLTDNHGKDFNWFTIQDTVFGNISLFDINFFDSKSGKESDPNIKIKEQVANWYYVIRNISLIASLIILVYTGIRMAIATTSLDQAKYKQMIVNWLKSILILFVLPYLLMFTLNIAQSLLDLIPHKSVDQGFETELITTINTQLSDKSVFKVFGAFIILCLLAYYQFRFFVKYLFRLFKAAFLIVISPLITITYSLDKGQAHSKWFQNYISVVFMQVIHAFIYSIFMLSASEIAAKAPIIATAFFMALTRGEKIFTYLLNLRSND